MIERSIKFLFKIGLMIFALLGVRYILSFIGVVIPFEWFVVMIAGMFSFYGVIIIIAYAVFLNFP